MILDWFKEEVKIHRSIFLIICFALSCCSYEEKKQQKPFTDDRDERGKRSRPDDRDDQGRRSRPDDRSNRGSGTIAQRNDCSNQSNKIDFRQVFTQDTLNAVLERVEERPLERCRKTVLEGYAFLPSFVTIEWTIQNERVVSTKVMKNEPGSGTLNQCIMRLINNWKPPEALPIGTRGAFQFFFRFISSDNNPSSRPRIICWTGVYQRLGDLISSSCFTPTSNFIESHYHKCNYRTSSETR